ncbi:transmembrane protein 126A [Uranotaenia lowii]|uniref:transmembrane protein 126A n=1 Tax=Uranotaenia lowii TaxID=190385 RepID=UPI0024784EBF|nr:transmembrane protein 126A [Uranotaenia lowii]
MALLHKKQSEIPEDAVKLSEADALIYITKIIEGWPEQGQIWPITYAPGMLGASTVVSSIFINNHFRNRLKLGTYGRLSSYIPAVVLPAIMSTFFHKGFIVPDVILQKNECPVCIQTRAGFYQAAFSTAYPMILAPLSSFMFATRHFTYRMPSITENPRDVLRLYKKLSSPITLAVVGFFAFNMMLSMFLTGKEYETVYKINLKLNEEVGFEEMESASINSR